MLVMLAETWMFVIVLHALQALPPMTVTSGPTNLVMDAFPEKTAYPICTTVRLVSVESDERSRSPWPAT